MPEQGFAACNLECGNHEPSQLTFHTSESHCVEATFLGLQALSGPKPNSLLRKGKTSSETAEGEQPGP